MSQTKLGTQAGLVANWTWTIGHVASIMVIEDPVGMQNQYKIACCEQSTWANQMEHMGEMQWQGWEPSMVRRGTQLPIRNMGIGLPASVHGRWGAGIGNRNMGMGIGLRAPAYGYQSSRIRAWNICEYRHWVVAGISHRGHGHRATGIKPRVLGNRHGQIAELATEPWASIYGHPEHGNQSTYIRASKYRMIADINYRHMSTGQQATGQGHGGIGICFRASAIQTWAPGYWHPSMGIRAISDTSLRNKGTGPQASGHGHEVMDVGE